MTPEQFTYWLQGMFDITNPLTLSVKEVQIIKDHLALVFERKTPDRNNLEYGPSLPGFITPNPPLPLVPTWRDDTIPSPYVVTCDLDPHQTFC